MEDRGSDRYDNTRVRPQAGSASELYGAKITGGGSGGTVCVVGKRGAQADAGIEHVLKEYSAATAHQPHVFHGSSPGAAQFGHLKLSFV
jgi:L-arabinokinase